MTTVVVEGSSCACGEGGNSEPGRAVADATPPFVAMLFEEILDGRAMLSPQAFVLRNVICSLQRKLLCPRSVLVGARSAVAEAVTVPRLLALRAMLHPQLGTTPTQEVAHALIRAAVLLFLSTLTPPVT